MFAKFRQAVSITVKGEDGQDVPHVFMLNHDNTPKIHEVPDAVANHPNFEFYKKAGYIVDVDDSQVVLQETTFERNERISKVLNKESLSALDQQQGKSRADLAAEVEARKEVEAEELSKGTDPHEMEDAHDQNEDAMGDEQTAGTSRKNKNKSRR